jgi:small subunit ribosomal protein S7
MRRPVKNRNHAGKDRKYDNELVAKFINHLMLDGKKELAQRIVYTAFEIIEKKEKGAKGIEIFEEALRNTGPNMEVRSRRVGGANYQVPREVRQERREFLAMTWIIDAARSREGTAMEDRLAEEIINASKNEGAAVTKRENTHKMAEANRAFAHFAW